MRCASRLPIKQRELGQQVQATRESVNKNLSAMRRRGLISTVDSAIVLLDLAGLRTLAGHRGERQ